MKKVKVLILFSLFPFVVFAAHREAREDLTNGYSFAWVLVFAAYLYLTKAPAAPAAPAKTSQHQRKTTIGNESSSSRAARARASEKTDPAPEPAEPAKRDLTDYSKLMNQIDFCLFDLQQLQFAEMNLHYEVESQNFKNEQEKQKYIYLHWLKYENEAKAEIEKSNYKRDQNNN